MGSVFFDIAYAVPTPAMAPNKWPSHETDLSAVGNTPDHDDASPSPLPMFSLYH